MPPSPRLPILALLTGVITFHLLLAHYVFHLPVNPFALPEPLLSLLLLLVVSFVMANRKGLHERGRTELFIACSKPPSRNPEASSIEGFDSSSNHHLSLFSPLISSPPALPSATLQAQV